MFEIKLQIEAGPILAAALTAIIGNSSATAQPEKVKIPEKLSAETGTKPPVEKIAANVQSTGSASLKALRELIEIKASDKVKRPAIAAVFKEYGVKGASDLAETHYADVYAKLSAL